MLKGIYVQIIIMTTSVVWSLSAHAQDHFRIIASTIFGDSGLEQEISQVIPDNEYTISYYSHPDLQKAIASGQFDIAIFVPPEFVDAHEDELYTSGELLKNSGDNSWNSSMTWVPMLATSGFSIVNREIVDVGASLDVKDIPDLVQTGTIFVPEFTYHHFQNDNRQMMDLAISNSSAEAITWRPRDILDIHNRIVNGDFSVILFPGSFDYRWASQFENQISHVVRLESPDPISALALSVRRNVPSDLAANLTSHLLGGDFFDDEILDMASVSIPEDFLHEDIACDECWYYYDNGVLVCECTGCASE